jgi:hypothetical protein
MSRFRLIKPEANIASVDVHCECVGYCTVRLAVTSASAVVIKIDDGTEAADHGQIKMQAASIVVLAVPCLIQYEIALKRHFRAFASGQ